MGKELKHRMAEELREELASTGDLLVVGLGPMDAGTDHALRKTLRDQGARLRVIHNRTSRFALDDALQDLAASFTGPTALALVEQREDPDVAAIAKTLVEAERLRRVEVRGGFVEGEVLDRAGVRFLAATPDKPTLRGMLCGTLLGPARGLATALDALGGGLARCLKARMDQSTDSQTEE
ncbi:MAG: 50S ribosomal protein L10 [Planctomycetota bacterium]|jgi:large subunit ribosomal protein L10